MLFDNSCQTSQHYGSHNGSPLKPRPDNRTGIIRKIAFVACWEKSLPESIEKKWDSHIFSISEPALGWPPHSCSARSI
jgi:hypothetical protein